ncbi:holo-ACP synthase [Mucilaginibacter sp. KACC 22773]|jgi:phosphopantetheine--protein transferase-like protein|uniref:holo-ACP synthase n=1 Tax=Mucilaginibacter sp. KACC 22773 TaxID=3025671 RepID=UPI002365256C|nr:holo-ACP synthase [Mucilaginibacter sp. KACC 22773]WDF76448.1 holo-ACP synthase [Mucilaginibacter sp. KACC 22773]
MEHKIDSSVKELTALQRFAVGNDLVCLADFKTSLTDLFKNKVYTAAEMDYCDSFSDSILRYASTWAAKEAVYKAVKQIDPAPLSWKKIEIIRTKASGRPHVVLQPNLKCYQVSLTISHDGDYAWALALIDKIA